MHTFSETGTGVPAFLAKLWRLVDDPETNHLICWNKDGRSFIIQNQAQFARELLPLNYKHNNMASFIRQLNMYGFHKITSIDNGGLKFDRDEMEFSHPCFKRNFPHLLEHIKRKIANTKSLDEKAAVVKPEAISKVLHDVKAMRGRQDSLDSRFSVIKQENEALWREIASLRQKHAKQQQIVNKLIQFLITIVQPSRNMTSVKRHMQLMINDTPENAKFRKTSETESECGPVIHELGEELLDEVVDNDLIDPQSPYADNESSSELKVQRPHSSTSVGSQNYDYSNQSAEDAYNVAASSSGGTLGASKSAVTKKGVGGGSSIIRSVNPDGSHIVYHVTEVPDDVTGAEGGFNEENVLTTPLAREEMKRSQLLKQKNKQRRKQQDIASTSPKIHVDAASFTGARVSPTPAKLTRTNSPAKVIDSNPIQIKTEKTEIDPMIFINTNYPENRSNVSDTQLVSPNLSEDSRQSSSITGPALSSNALAVDMSMLNTSSDLYNVDEFISNDMPTDIFEETSLLAAEGDNNINANLEQQLTNSTNTIAGGKFSSYIAGENNGNKRNINDANGNVTSANGASTSAAAAAAAQAAATKQDKNINSNSSNKNNSNNNNMTVAKYKRAVGEDDIMRLSSPEEVHGHLENVQDELDSLKDILRGDGYSLDANTLLGNGTPTATPPIICNRFNLSQALEGDFFNKLFNDSDIMGPYGLHIFNEASNDRKGSELMTYQPLYDLSDMMDINEKSDLEEAGNPTSAVTGNSSSSGLNTPTLGSRSVLNTPHHD